MQFPTVIDSTMIGAFRSCPQKFFRQYLQHWKPKGESVHLVAGAAYARGLEIARRSFYENGMDAQDAEAEGAVALIKAYGDFACPPDSAKSLERMLGAFAFYFERYPLGGEGNEPIVLPSGKRAIEFSFAEPLEILHPETGDPLIFCGRTDMICHFADAIFVHDDKTASSLGPSWSQQWELRSQFTGYVWAALRAGIKAQGVRICGVSILKTKYDTQQVPSYRAPWEVERWYAQLLRDITRMIASWREFRETGNVGSWDYNLDHACAEFGGCILRTVCKSPSPDQWLPMYFEPRVWDPLKREEVTVES